jgi:hypothetical protein
LTETFICQNQWDLQKRGRSAAYREEVWLLNIERNVHLRFCISSSAAKTSETCRYKSPLSPPLPHINLWLFWCFKKILVLSSGFSLSFSISFFFHTMNACLLFLPVAVSLDVFFFVLELRFPCFVFFFLVHEEPGEGGCHQPPL